MPFKSLEDGHDAQLTNRYATQTFPIVDRFLKTNFYKEIRSVLEGELSKIRPEKSDPYYDKSLDRLLEESSVENLMSGTTNLINFVVEQARSGEPVQTMVFLDKSARNGAFLFRQLWNEFATDGVLEDVVMPDVRFMDIGRSDLGKHNAGSSWALLKDAFDPKLFPESGVLVVDEYVETGGSTRRALKTLQDVFDSKPVGIAQFEALPRWYGADTIGITGITDIKFDSARSQIFAGLRSVDGDLILRLKDAYYKYRDIFPNIVDMTSYRKAQAISTPANGISDEDDLLIRDVLEVCPTLSIGDGDIVKEFIASAGGFLARPLGSETLNAKSSVYRDMLKKMVVCYYMQLKTFSDNPNPNQGDTFTLYDTSHVHPIDED